MVITYSGFLPDIRAIIKKNRHILHRSDRMKEIFPKDPIVAYKRGSNLKHLLVHQRQDCGGRCAICKVSYAGETVPGAGSVVHYDKSIGCKTSNLVYGIWCVQCSKVVYVE